MNDFITISKAEYDSLKHATFTLDLILRYVRNETEGNSRSYINADPILFIAGEDETNA